MYYSSWVMCSFQKGFLEAIKAWWQEISGLIVAWSGGKYPDTTWAFRVSICLFLMMAFWEDLPGPKLPHCLATCSIPHSSLIKWKKKAQYSFLLLECAFFGPRKKILLITNVVCTWTKSDSAQYLVGSIPNTFICHLISFSPATSGSRHYN